VTAYSHGERQALPAAAWGMGVLIASEATVFGAMVATYFYFRFHTVEWPPPGIPEPAWAGPAISVAVLAAALALVQLAWRRVRSGRRVPARAALAVAFLFQAGYLAYAVHDYRDQLSAHPISENAYTSIYYTLLGAGHAHVLVGLLFDLWLLAKLAGGLTAYRLRATQVIAWYWSFVLVATIVVYATVLSARV
jgi:heme/copper-type cytochrome/quinol oxidase subunit 3